MTALTQSSNPAVWAGITAPEGHELGWKVVRPDGRTRGEFTWPLSPKLVRCLKADIVVGNTGEPCPSSAGDGLCIAKTWQGAASGGQPAITGLALAFKPEHILGEDPHKIRVSQCRVLAVLDLQRLIREGHARGANLSGANLSGANLYGANLSGANLSGADLSGARNVPASVTA